MGFAGFCFMGGLGSAGRLGGFGCDVLETGDWGWRPADWRRTGTASQTFKENSKLMKMQFVRKSHNFYVFSF